MIVDKNQPEQRLTDKSFLQPSSQLLQFRIHGLDCAEEVAVLKRELGPLVGEANLAFDVLNAKMTVMNQGKLSPQAIEEVVARTGMRAARWTDVKTALAQTGFWEHHRRTILTTTSGLLILFGALLHISFAGVRAALLEEETTTGAPVLVFVLYTFAILAGMWIVLPKAWIAAKHFRPDMNLLMVIAVVGAIAIGQWLEAATVAFLFALSLTLEAWSVGRARRAVSALMALAPPEVRLVLPNSQEVTTAPDNRRKWRSRSSTHYRRKYSGSQRPWRRGIRRHDQRRWGVDNRIN
jgi:Cd2+/Zn2+-exporting ATPase